MQSDQSKLIHQIDATICDIYVKNQLTNIAGLDASYIINGRQVLSWQGKLNDKSKKINPDFDFLKCFDECLFCSDEVMYFTAHLFLYQPFIVNPADSSLTVNGKTMFVLNQNLETKRYFMFLNIVFEKLYNYWDKLGDYIAAHFPGELKQDKIYFASILSHLKDKYKNSNALKWLISFKETEYRKFNEERKNIVHYFGAGTEFKWHHIYNHMNKPEILKAFNELNQIPNLMKQQMNFIREGIFNTLSFIEEI